MLIGCMCNLPIEREHIRILFLIRSYHKLLWHGRSGARSLSILENRDCRWNNRKWDQSLVIQLPGSWYYTQSRDIMQLAQQKRPQKVKTWKICFKSLQFMQMIMGVFRACTIENSIRKPLYIHLGCTITSYEGLKTTINMSKTASHILTKM